VEGHDGGSEARLTIGIIRTIIVLKIGGPEASTKKR